MKQAIRRILDILGVSYLLKSIAKVYNFPFELQAAVFDLKRQMLEQESRMAGWQSNTENQQRQIRNSIQQMEIEVEHFFKKYSNENQHGSEIRECLTDILKQISDIKKTMKKF